MNILCVGKKFGVHIEDPARERKPLCGKVIDPFFISQVKNLEDNFCVRCPACRKMWKGIKDEN